MAGRSFEITNARQFYNKLIEEYEAFRADPLSSRIAINSAMTAWHLSEWLYEEYQSILHTKYPNRDSYLLNLRTTLCPDLDVMRGIANGSKHCKPPSNAQRVQDTAFHGGAFSREFSRDFDVSYLTVTLDDGSVIAFEDALSRVIAFWKAYLVREFGLTL